MRTTKARSHNPSTHAEEHHTYVGEIAPVPATSKKNGQMLDNVELSQRESYRSQDQMVTVAVEPDQHCMEQRIATIEVRSLLLT
jgi:hypothetical protein